MTGTARRPKAHSAKNQGRATIGDIAAAAGVSKMTVSRVMSSPWSVRPDTRERVMKVAEAMHYTPNRSARVLSGAQQIRLGLLYNMPRSSYIVDLLMGAMDQASLMDIQLVSRPVELGGNALTTLQGMVDNGVDGVILTPPLCDAPDILAYVATIDLPVLLIGTDAANMAVSTISIDEAAAAREMTEYLIRRGHRRIAFIKGEPVLAASHIRVNGFAQAMAAHGLPVPEAYVAQGFYTYRSGLDAAEALLRLDPRPTAIFASNDDMAAAAITVAHRLGLEVPRDVSIVGFDDSWIATSIYPELTTIRQPIRELATDGIQTMARVVRALREGEATTHRLVAPYTLIVRQSDAPYPSAAPSA